VAVLPFRNEADDPDVDYLSDGVAESLLDALARLPKLRVLARSTVSRCKSRLDEPIEVGRDLGVEAVVIGRLRQRGDELRISCELVRVADGARLWGCRYERSMAELLTIREEIGEALAQHLRGKAPRGTQRAAARPGRATPRLASAPAYQAYLKGRHFWNRWTADSMRTSIRHYEEAIAIDPNYALAWAGLADGWAALGQTKAMPPAEAFPRSKAAAMRALELDDRLAEAHASLGFVQRFWDWDWPASEASLRRAIALAPSYTTAHRWYGHLCTGLARHDEALAEVHSALDLEPVSLIIQTVVGDAYFYARRYDEAIVFYRRALELEPEFFAGRSDLARALEHSGHIAEAVSEYERAIRMAGTSMADPSAGLANVLAVSGRSDEARAMLHELSRQRGERYVSPWALASIHARLGELPEALTWLERAYDEHDSTLVWLKVHPRFDPLRGETRFAALLERMRL
jgi:eukaryotic-like serine/threonine-protein kinase